MLTVASMASMATSTTGADFRTSDGDAFTAAGIVELNQTWLANGDAVAGQSWDADTVAFGATFTAESAGTVELTIEVGDEIETQGVDVLPGATDVSMSFEDHFPDCVVNTYGCGFLIDVTLTSTTPIDLQLYGVFTLDASAPPTVALIAGTP